MSRRRGKGRGLDGSAKLRRVLQRAEPEIRAEVGKTTENIAQRILGAQQQMVSVRTGALRAALSYRVSKNGLRALIGLVTKRLRRDFFYARFLEAGTKNAPARPFLAPSFFMYADIYKALSAAAIDRALKLVVRGRD